MTQKELARPQETRESAPHEVVRVLVSQACSLEELREQIIDHPDAPWTAELSRHWFGIKGSDSTMPLHWVPLGGSIEEDSDRKSIKKVVNPDEETAEQLTWQGKNPLTPELQDLAIQQYSASRHLQERTHLLGVRREDVGTAIGSQLGNDSYSRTLEFYNSHDYRWQTNRENWLSVRAPHDYRPHLFFPQQDRLILVAPLTPSQIHDLLEREQLAWEGKLYPLTDNLLREEHNRELDSVHSNQEDVERIRSIIAFNSQLEEVAMRYELVTQLIGHAAYHPRFGKRRLDERNSRTLKEFQSLVQAADIEGFNEKYREFLTSFGRKLPAEGSSHTRVRSDRMRQEMLAAWHRVLFKSYVDILSDSPIQGPLLLTGLDWHETATDEWEYMADRAPEYTKRLARFIDVVLSPPKGTLPHDDLSSAPDTMEERYRRIALLRSLHRKALTTSPSTPEAHLFRVWSQWIEVAMLDALGMTQHDFEQASAFHNNFFAHLRKHEYPKFARSPVTPILLARAPDSQVTQITELIMHAFNFSPYKDAPMGVGIDLKTVIDSRYKLANLPIVSDILKLYYKKIHRSSFVWRQIMYDLFEGHKEQTQKQTVHSRVFAQRVDESVERETKGELQQTGLENHFILSFSNGDIRRVLAKPARETEESGFDLVHHALPLEHQGIPLWIYEKGISDKEPEAYYRKALERNYSPERILDVFRTLLCVDTLSPTVQEALKREYKSYIGETGRHGMSFDEWVILWANSAISEVLVPTMKEHANNYGFAFGMIQKKDKLNTKEPTAGSAASEGGYRDYKFYAELTPESSEPESLTDTQDPLTVEVSVFPTPEDLLIKLYGDDPYGERRWDTVKPGSGDYPLNAVFFHESIYPYDDIASAGARRQLRQMRKGSVQKLWTRLGRMAMQIFGPIRHRVF